MYFYCSGCNCMVKSAKFTEPEVFTALDDFSVSVAEVEGELKLSSINFDADELKREIQTAIDDEIVSVSVLGDQVAIMGNYGSNFKCSRCNDSIEVVDSALASILRVLIPKCKDPFRFLEVYNKELDCEPGMLIASEETEKLIGWISEQDIIGDTIDERDDEGSDEEAEQEPD